MWRSRFPLHVRKSTRPTDVARRKQSSPSPTSGRGTRCRWSAQSARGRLAWSSSLPWRYRRQPLTWSWQALALIRRPATVMLFAAKRWLSRSGAVRISRRWRRPNADAPTRHMATDATTYDEEGGRPVTRLSRFRNTVIKLNNNVCVSKNLPVYRSTHPSTPSRPTPLGTRLRKPLGFLIPSQPKRSNPRSSPPAPCSAPPSRFTPMMRSASAASLSLSRPGISSTVGSPAKNHHSRSR